MRRSRSAFDSTLYVAGQHVPRVVAGLVAAVLVVTILAAVGKRNGLPVFELATLVPELVLRGQVWRLVTWPFIAGDFLPLVFGCLALWFVGRDLASAWGGARFLGVFFAVAAAAGALTCLVALVWPLLRIVPLHGTWAMVDALFIAWAILFPARQILMWFVLPLRGQTLLYVVVGGTVLVSLLDGPVFYVPHFMAELLMLAWLKLPQWRAQVAVRMQRRRRASHLRTVGSWGEKPRWYH
ncbi:MAG TPA: rhomboid family intramembrane serine protease [Vicinamibacteria bacterium]|nr:rhomboid family intramembrane serine protease [Vicinamibacteria bacterium]